MSAIRLSITRIVSWQWHDPTLWPTNHVTRFQTLTANHAKRKHRSYSIRARQPLSLAMNLLAPGPDRHVANPITRTTKSHRSSNKQLCFVFFFLPVIAVQSSSTNV